MLRTKIADYVIYQVHYNKNNQTRTHIESVKLCADLGNGFGEPQIWLREKVVQYIESGRVFYTLYQKNGNWVDGDKVEVVTINGKKYIRTDGNRKESDNLGNLPEF